MGTFGSVLVLCKTSSRPSGSVPSAPSTSPFAETSLGVSLPGTSSSSSSSLPLGGQGKRGGLGVRLVFFLGVLPPLPLDFGPARGAGVPLGICLSRAGSLLLLLLLREVEARSCSLAADALSRFSKSVDSPNSHRTFHDVRIRGRLQSLAPAFFPPTSHALRGVDRGRIRGLGHVGVAPVDFAVALALAPLAVSVGGGHRPRPALLVVAHAVSGRGLLTATALGVEALGHIVTGLDPRIGIGHTVSVCVPLPVGGSGAVVRDRTLSRIVRVTARGQACDYLLFLPACGPWKQDGWPDVAPGGCGGVCLSASCGLVQRRVSLLLQEGRPLPLSRLFCRSLPSSS